jgi:ABC-type uncharacterized transport system substrate-binding protein
LREASRGKRDGYELQHRTTGAEADSLRKLVPQATLFGYLANVATSSEIARQDLVASARSIGVEVVVFYASAAGEIDSAFESMAARPSSGG